MIKSRIQESQDVDITPMIDIVFQLIIFFMVVMAIAAVYGVAIKFPPPGQASPQQNKDKQKSIVVFVGADHIEANHQLVRDGILKINGEEITMIKSDDYTNWEKERNQAYDRLENIMQEFIDKNYKKDVLIIQGNMKTYHGKVMRVIDKAKNRGIEGFSLVPPNE
ncbi:MAG: hypothetical protein GF398_11725 [Chitinivibrionales bacterium]|nr:hypothetical protein [Chitinivibrionales bacterium]